MPLLEETVARRAPIRRAVAAEWAGMATTAVADLVGTAALVNTQVAVASAALAVLEVRVAAVVAGLADRGLDKSPRLRVSVRQVMEIKVLLEVTAAAAAAAAGSEARVAILVLRP